MSVGTEATRGLLYRVNTVLVPGTGDGDDGDACDDSVEEDGDDSVSEDAISMIHSTLPQWE